MDHTYIDELPSDEESCYYAEHLVFHPDPDPAVPPAYTDDELAAVLPYGPHISAAYLSGIPDLSSRTLLLLALLLLPQREVHERQRDLRRRFRLCHRFELGLGL